MLALYFYAMICDTLHGRIACEPLPCRNLYPGTPAVRLDALLLTTASTTHYICDVMLGGLFVSG
jgi:hypothetical protein